jgi:hypothetical protein
MSVIGQIQDEMRDDQEHMRAAISANEEMIEAGQKQMKAKMRASQEKMEATITATQEKMKATINVGQEKIQATSVIWPVQIKFKETIHKWMLGILASVDQWTHTLCNKLDSEIQGTQLDIQVTKMVAEGTCWEPKTKQADVEAQAGSEVGRNTVTSTHRAKQLGILRKGHTPTHYTAGASNI